MYRPAVHGGCISDTATEPKAANPKADEWAERIAAQQRGGISVKQFCREQGPTEYSFYAWLCLAETAPGNRARAIRLSGVGRAPAGAHGGGGAELVLTSGERLRISLGVEITTLRTVLDVLRA